MDSTRTTGPPDPQADLAFQRQLREMNEALLVSSVRQHELAEQAQKAEAALRDSADRLRQSHAFTESIVATVREPLLVLDKDLRVLTASRAFYEKFRVTPEGTENRLLYDLGNGQWDIPDLRRLLEEVLPRDNQVNDFAVEHEFEHIGTKTMLLNARRLIQATDQAPLILLAIEDITERKRLEDELRQVAAEMHEYTASIVATVREPLLVLDKDLRVRTASASFYQTYLVKPEETINRLLYDLGNGQWNIPALRRLLEEILPRDNQVNDFAVEHEFEHIGTKTMRLNARRLVQAADQAPLILLAIEDITERKRLEDELRQVAAKMHEYTESIVATVREPLLVLDKDLRVQSASRSFYKNFRVTPEGTENRLLYDLGNGQWDIPDLRRLLEEVLPRDNQVNDFAVVHEFEHIGTKTMRLNARRLIQAADQAPLILLAIEDVTESDRQAVELRQYAAELSEADRRKNEFLAMLSHELRNPLSAIFNALHVLRLHDTKNPIQQKAKSVIERQVGQLAHLIDDLLEVSRVITGRIQLHQERLEMRSIVERAIESARPLIDRRKHELSLSLPAEPIWLQGDPTRLEQVVVNLLNNAAKYTDEGGQIWLTAQQEGGEVVLFVRDTGVGIAPELLPRIFDLFTQADRTLDRSQGGLGIGLSLVQKLVELHGGTVEAHSVGLGQGSEFIVRLPALSPARESIGPIETAKQPAQTSRVLVVDDNVDVADMLVVMLQMFGHEVQAAYSGQTALETAVEYQPDVVLLDIGLPDMDGYEVARRLRRQPQTKDVWLIAMTGYGQDSDRQRSEEAGFDHHLVKPVDSQKLQDLLAKPQLGVS